MAATNLVSEQRWLASHGVRPQAKNFSAFSKFTQDLSLCLEAVGELLAMIEKEFGVNGEEAQKRHEAKKRLPIIQTADSPRPLSIFEATRMKGKTVERVEVGFREPIEGVHASEAMIIYFTDGSIMGVETGSNAGNLESEERPLRSEDFHVDFIVHWVPERPNDTSGNPRKKKEDGESARMGQ